jgi:wyosine [tRNA(Phe)-imidazoG37] synthetase (radical SAM superfamily)
MKYIYGPVKSRRLGLSLGVSLTPQKVCNLDCLYCQLGKTGEKSGERREYIKAAQILEEVASWLSRNPEQAKGLDYITLSGQGEPTLNSAIADIIAGIRRLTSAKLALITNATLLVDKEVRAQVLAADLIVPSLDAAQEEVFRKINRPAPGLIIEKIIGGLIKLRKEFSGQIWLEVMLVAGLNDSPEHIRALKQAIARIRPDKVQLNSPVRGTAEPGIFPVEKARLGQIREILGGRCEVVS